MIIYMRKFGKFNAFRCAIFATLILSAGLTGCATQRYERPDYLASIAVDKQKESLAQSAFQAVERDAEIAFNKAHEKFLDRSSENGIIEDKNGHKKFTIRDSSVDIDVTSQKPGVCKIRYVGGINEAGEENFYIAIHASIKMGCNDTLVKLDSLGGSTLSGIKMGLIIRQYGYNTMPYKYLLARYANAYVGVQGDDGCYSACTLVFVGGNKRFGTEKVGFGILSFAFEVGKLLTSDIGQLGFHQAKDGQTNKCVDDPNAPINLLIREYYKKMLPGFTESVYGQYLSASCTSVRTLNTFESIYNVLVNESYTLDTMMKY